MPKPLLATLRDLYTYRYFNDPGKAPRYRGVYSTYAAAESALPKGRPKGFNLETVSDYFIKCELNLNPSDYPVLFWLSRIIGPETTVFDLGGGLGQCYYNYNSYLNFPPDLRWTICDVDALMSRGSELARENNVRGLSFTSDRTNADGVQVYISSGALHYIEPDLSEILSQLSNLPQHLLIHRIPLYAGPRYYTMQNTPHSYSVNKVLNESEFVKAIEALGYERVDDWRMQRSLHIPFHPERFVPHYRGFYFRKVGLSH
jgi:putative methyltransferase (TIGR04325 family)